jgi:hypothetical protein
MVGGTIFHRCVIQREISRVLVLNLWHDKTGGACAPPRTTTPLTEPSLLSRATRLDRSTTEKARANFVFVEERPDGTGRTTGPFA